MEVARHTPQKSNIDTKNGHILKEPTFSKPSFWISMLFSGMYLIFWGIELEGYWLVWDNGGIFLFFQWPWWGYISCMSHVVSTHVPDQRHVLAGAIPWTKHDIAPKRNSGLETIVSCGAPRNLNCLAFLVRSLSFLPWGVIVIYLGLCFGTFCKCCIQANQSKVSKHHVISTIGILG